MSRDQDRIVANASLVQYNEITPENADSFHFHGDLSDYPLSAVLVVPNDTKSGVILQGRLENAEADTRDGIHHTAVRRRGRRAGRGGDDCGGRARDFIVVAPAPSRAADAIQDWRLTKCYSRRYGRRNNGGHHRQQSARVDVDSYR
jgi:hypothetical protein